MDPQLFQAYRDSIDRGLADGSLMTREQVNESLKAFQENFSPCEAVRVGRICTSRKTTCAKFRDKVPHVLARVQGRRRVQGRQNG